MIRESVCHPLDLPHQGEGSHSPGGCGVINPYLPQDAEDSVCSLKYAHKPPVCPPSACLRDKAWLLQRDDYAASLRARFHRCRKGLELRGSVFCGWEHATLVVDGTRAWVL